MYAIQKCLHLCDSAGLWETRYVTDFESEAKAILKDILNDEDGTWRILNTLTQTVVL